MSLPQTDNHTCPSCAKKVGETCKRKRKQLIGYCIDWEPKTSLGVKGNDV